MVIGKVSCPYDDVLRVRYITGLYPQSLRHGAIDECSGSPVFCGGFADVHQGKAQNQALAVKIMRNRSRKPATCLMKAICREAILWSHISHPNILPFYGIFLKPDGDGTPGRLCLLSPWMVNGKVLDYIKSNPDVNRESLLQDVAKGLHYLHSFRPAIIHGDIKGDNILVSPSGRACLADFGLGRLVHDKDWLQSTISVLDGTQLYLAPELWDVADRPEKAEGLIHGGADQGIRKTQFTDIYALGCLFYEIYTGKPRFFEIKSPLGRLTAMKMNTPCDKPILMKDELWAKVQDCWDKIPKNRPPVTHFFALFSKRRDLNDKGSDIDEYNWDGGIRSRVRPPPFAITSESSSSPVLGEPSKEMASISNPRDFAKRGNNRMIESGGHGLRGDMVDTGWSQPEAH